MSLKKAAIVVVTMIIFFQDLYIAANNALQSESTSHILTSPTVSFIYIIYSKRKMISASISLEPSQAAILNNTAVYNQRLQTTHKATSTQLPDIHEVSRNAE
jgi:hypothetical protein